MLIVGAIGAVIFFIFQLIFCFKIKRIVLKCIPLYFIILGVIYCFAAWNGMLGRQTAGALYGNQIMAIVCAIVVALTATGVAGAWIAYRIILRRRDEHQ